MGEYSLAPPRRPAPKFDRVRPCSPARPLAAHRSLTAASSRNAHHPQNPRRGRQNARGRAAGGASVGHDWRACAGRRHHRAPEPNLPRLHRRRTAGDAGAAELPRLPQVDLHFGQPCGLPRHPVRAPTETRRHHQHRHHGHQGRLPRRHQSHVFCRRCVGARAAGVPNQPRMFAPRHRVGETRRAPRRLRPRHSTPRRGQRLLGGARVLRPRHRPRLPRRPASAALRQTRHRPGAAGRHDLHHRADAERRAARDPTTAGQLDGDYQRPQFVGAVGTHDFGYRQRA